VIYLQFLAIKFFKVLFVVSEHAYANRFHVKSFRSNDNFMFFLKYCNFF